jgi:hypothetical protein
MALTWTKTPGRWRWRAVPSTYKKIDKYERAGDKNCLEPVWKEHWEELRVDIITALTLALLFDALLEETTEVGGTTYGPIVLEAFHLGCGLKTGLRAPAQSLVHVRWMAISIINQFLPKGVLRDLFQTKVVKANKPILQFILFMDKRFFTAERPLTFQVDAQLAFEKRRWDTSTESSSTSFTDFMWDSTTSFVRRNAPGNPTKTSYTLRWTSGIVSTFRSNAL